MKDFVGGTIRWRDAAPNHSLSWSSKRHWSPIRTSRLGYIHHSQHSRHGYIDWNASPSLIKCPATTEISKQNNTIVHWTGF